MSSDNCLEVVDDAYTTMVFDEGIKVIGVFHQGLLDLDESQNEALIQPHQLRLSGVVYDDVARVHLGNKGQHGTQSIKVQNLKLPLFFDSYKTYYRLVKPTEEDLRVLPHVEMTSRDKYEPHNRTFVEHMVNQNSPKQTTIAKVFNIRRRPVSEPVGICDYFIIKYASDDDV